MARVAELRGARRSTLAPATGAAGFELETNHIPSPYSLEDPTTGIGQGAPGTAVDAMGHWADAPEPMLALMSVEPDAG